MKKITIKLLTFSIVALTCGCSYNNFPSLIGSSQDKNVVVRSGSYEDAKGSNTGTFVGQKIIAFRQELEQIKISHQSNTEELKRITKNIAANATQYNNTVGSIESKLQIGTTPGNPNLYNMLQQVQNNVQTMSMNANALNNLSVKVANNATSTAYLVDSIRAAFNISGAVDEDHRQLRSLQNEAEQLLITINSINNEINNDSNRQQQFLISAQDQMSQLNAAIRVGNFKSSEPIIKAKSKPVLFGTKDASLKKTTDNNAFLTSKPLFIAKFNHDNISYKEGLETAVKAAVNRKSNSIFEVIAVSNINSAAKAQQHASKIFEEIVALGVNPNNINLNAKNSPQTKTAEVWIFVR